MNQQQNEWSERYVPQTAEIWKGRCDGGDSKRFHEVVDCVDLRENFPNPGICSFGLVGFSCDEGVSRNLGRPGARLGPQSLRNSLAKFPIDTAKPVAIFDVGNVKCDDGRLSHSQEAFADIIAKLIMNKIHPVGIGGGHEIAWATYQGICKAYPDKNIAVINFDAHFDMRPLLDGTKGTSGTSFAQIAASTNKRDLPFNYTCIGIQRYGNTKMLFDIARKHNVSYVTAEEIYLKGWEKALDKIEEILETNDLIYTTICLDVFSSAIAPGVSAPQVLGLMPWQVIPLLRRLAQSKKVVCLDVAELNPAYDPNSTTSELAAALVCEYIHHKL